VTAAPSTHSGEVAAQNGAITKIRRRLLPYLLLLYAIAFLDRVNVSYAKPAMSAAIHGYSASYGWVAGIFFIGYVLFEVPSNLAFRRFGARRWISRIMISWGAVASLTAAFSTPDSIGAVRFVLGVSEAGFFPGVALYLTLWLPRREMARAFAVFICAQVVSGIVGAPVSGVILDHVHWAGLASWRWLFILEAAPAVLLGVLTWRVLPADPSEARWLSDAEREWVLSATAAERRVLPASTHDGMWSVFRNPQAAVLAIADLLLVIGAFGLTFYLPSIVASFGHMSNTKTDLLSAVPLAVGGVAMLVNGWHSDRVRERPMHVGAAAAVGAAGLLLLAHSRSPSVSLIALSLAAVGAYGYISAYWPLPSSVLPEAAAPVGLAAINSVGSFGGFLGPYLVGWLSNGSGASSDGVSATALYVLAGSFLTAVVVLLVFRVVPDRWYLVFPRHRIHHARGQTTDRLTEQSAQQEAEEW
jgi:ACS family tartrate transporter-like MFS transporter